MQIWEDLDAGPRAFLACPAAVKSSVDEALSALPRLSDLRREIILDRQVPNACAPGSLAPGGTLESFSARGNDVTIRYRADAPGILVVADAYHEGWQARLDGVPADILRVNGAFRGVAIPQAGVHLVEYSYRPPHWRASLGAAAAGLVVLLISVVAPGRRDSV